MPTTVCASAPSCESTRARRQYPQYQRQYSRLQYVVSMKYLTADSALHSRTFFCSALFMRPTLTRALLRPRVVALLGRLTSSQLTVDPRPPAQKQGVHCRDACWNPSNSAPLAKGTNRGHIPNIRQVYSISTHRYQVSKVTTG